MKKTPKWLIGLVAVIVCLVLLALVTRDIKQSYNGSAGNLFSNNQGNVESPVANKKAVVGTTIVETCELAPGKAPKSFETNGNFFSWNIRSSYDGKEVLWMRLKLKNGDYFIWHYPNGKSSDWLNIFGVKIEAGDIPDFKEIKSVEFGVPDDGANSTLDFII